MGFYTREDNDQIEINSDAMIGPKINPVIPKIEIPPIVVNNIEDAQSQLFNLGLYNAEIDGKNNSLNISAIKEFQKLAGLVVDGILGPKTQIALDKGEDSYVKITVNETSTSRTVEFAMITSPS